MFINLPREVEIFIYPCLSAVFLYLRDGTLDVATIMSCVDFEGLLLRPLRGVSPVTFRRLLHTIHVRHLPTAYPHLLEVVTPFVVVECIDGENLLSLDSRQSEDSRNVIIPVFELRLVEQDFHITVINDSLLDNGRINHIVQFLCHYSGDAVELTHRLIQIFDVLSHRRGGDGFPCLFDDESLSAFLDTHFLKEHIHDDEHDDREQHGIVLDFVSRRR